MPTDITPAMYGMATIILLQLSQFYFAWRKDQRGADSAWKDDIDALRDDLKASIQKVESDVHEVKKSLGRESEASRNSAHDCRNQMHTRITEIALETAALVKGQALTEQTLISLGNKVDLLRFSNNTLINGTRKTP